MLDMRRRQFIALLGGAVSWPLAARAQPPPMQVVGFLGGATADGWAPYVAPFLQGLSETGYVEGRNVAIEYRFADGQYDRLPGMVADLIERQERVIAATGTPAALAAKAATRTIPIVFEVISDPVQIGLVASLNRPGGNVTGVTQLNVEIGPKLLELIHEVVPTATNIVLLVNPTNPTADSLSRNLEAAARTLGVRLHVVEVSTERDIDAAFATLVELRAGGLVMGGDAFINTRSRQIAALALRHAVPSIYQSRVFTTAGGLMSYGGDSANAYQHAGVYVGRILKGEKPTDLPVVQATKVELVINLTTAKALGLTMPITLLGRADEVIE
jgi:putative ABC transport system substrate-binding protein